MASTSSIEEQVDDIIDNIRSAVYINRIGNNDLDDEDREQAAQDVMALITKAQTEARIDEIQYANDEYFLPITTFRKGWVNYLNDRVKTLNSLKENTK